MKAPNFEDILKSIGENNNTPTIAMCLIAIFKGIFRPMFTMMDKKSDPETKKYAAIREGLTEVAALPLYAVTPFLAAKLAHYLGKQLKNEVSVNPRRMEATSKFIGLGVATLLIPAVCNIIQPPIMAAYKKRQESKKAQLGNTNITNPVTQVSQPLQTTFKSNFNRGMKVGG